MNQDTRDLLELLIDKLTDAADKQQHCHGGCQCNCPEKNMLEQSAVRFNEQASYASSQLQFAAQQQHNAQFSALLAQQAQFSNGSS